MSKRDTFHKYFFVLFFAAVLLIAYLIVKPFLTTILIGSIIAYIFHPLYRWIKKKTKRPALSAITVILILLLFVSAPLTLITGKIVQESYVVYLQAKIAMSKEDVLNLDCDERGGLMCGLLNRAKEIEAKYNIKPGMYLERAFNGTVSSIFNSLSNFLMSLPQMMFKLLVMVFVLFYAFTDGKKIMDSLKRILPLNKTHINEITKLFSDIVYATIYGNVVLAIIQGILTGIGFWIFGIGSPLFWGVIAIVASFIPFLGAGLVWFPAAMTLLFTGLVSNNSSVVMRAVGLSIYGLLLISTIDNILKPKIVGEKARLHPMVILLGAFGGIALFGIAGLMIGPLLLSLFIVSIRIYEKEKGVN